MNVQNLKKVRDHLQQVVLPSSSINFNMGSFSASRNNFQTKEEILEGRFCDTSACVIGHASSVIPILEGDISSVYVDAESGCYRFYTDWHKYSERIFSIDTSSKVWHFLFSGEWNYNEDDPVSQLEEAIARLSHVIDNGAEPHGWHYNYNDYYCPS